MGRAYEPFDILVTAALKTNNKRKFKYRSVYYRRYLHNCSHNLF